MSDNSAFPEVDQFYVRSSCLDQADDVGGRKDEVDDIGKSSGVPDRGLREIDREIENIETSGSDSSTTRGKDFIDQMDKVAFTSEDIKECGSGGVQEEKYETMQSEEKHQRKRKRSIMNAKQITLIEKALLDEPDMQRNAASIQTWADKLSVHGSEVTSSQLKNWLNNRKARLARAAKDIRPAPEGDSAVQERQGGLGIASRCESPESLQGDMSLRETHLSGIGQHPLQTSLGENPSTAAVKFIAIVPAQFARCEPGQNVKLVDGQGEEIGIGKVHQVQGIWYGRNLKDLEMCVVDVIELKAEKWARLPHPYEATGTSFAEAETKLGTMRVLWDLNKLFVLQPRWQHR